jgi:hypothetical protein
MFYVYEHIRPDTNAIFYVGKGSKKRINSKKDRNKYWNNIVFKCDGFESNILLETDDEDFAFFVEEEVIDLYKKRGIKLSNLTNGGEGLSGLKHSIEAKEKMRIHALNRIHPKHTEESKEKIRKASTGVIFTEERKSKISEKAKGRKMPEHIKQLHRNKRFKHAPETLEKMKEIQRAMPKTKCPHCDFIGNVGNLKRWHLDNCKRKVK